MLDALVISGLLRDGIFVEPGQFKSTDILQRLNVFGDTTRASKAVDETIPHTHKRAPFECRPIWSFDSEKI